MTDIDLTAIKKRAGATKPGRAYPPLTEADKTFLSNAKNDVTVLIAAIEERDSAIIASVKTCDLLMKQRDEQVDIIAAMREYLQHMPCRGALSFSSTKAYCTRHKCEDCGGKGNALAAFDRKHGGK